MADRLDPTDSISGEFIAGRSDKEQEEEGIALGDRTLRT